MYPFSFVSRLHGNRAGAAKAAEKAMFFVGGLRPPTKKHPKTLFCPEKRGG